MSCDQPITMLKCVDGPSLSGTKSCHLSFLLSRDMGKLFMTRLLIDLCPNAFKTKENRKMTCRKGERGLWRENHIPNETQERREWRRVSSIQEMVPVEQGCVFLTSLKVETG